MKFQRRRYIVNRGLQIKFTLLFVVVSLAGSILTTAAFNVLALRKLETLTWSSHINVKNSGELVNPLFTYANIFNFLFVAALLIVMGVWMLRKTSGPIYRMTKDIIKVADGNLSTDITLRQKDEFRDVASELDAMVKELRGRFNGISNKYTNITKAIGKLEYSNRAPEAGKNELSSILSDIKDIEAELGRFSVKERPQKKETLKD